MEENGEEVEGWLKNEWDPPLGRALECSLYVGS